MKTMKMTGKAMMIMSRSRLLDQLMMLVYLVLLLLSEDAAAGKKKHPKAPRIFDRAFKVTALAGATGYIECKTKGKPRPDINWEKDGRPLEQFGDRFSINKRSGALRVFKAQIGDTANYTCIAKNRHGQDSMTVRMQVFQKPVIEISPYKHVTLEEGDSLQITCRANAWPTPSYLWYTSQEEKLKTSPVKNESSVAPSYSPRYRLESWEESRLSSVSVLTIDQVTYRDHGIFLCHAGNRGGSNKAYVNVDVKFPPKPASPHSGRQIVFYYMSESAPPFSLFCDVYGNEHPEVYWVYNDTFLNTSHCRTQRQDTPPRVRSYACTVNERTLGLYRCLAKNSYGEAQIQEFDVQPLYAPRPLTVEVNRQYANRIHVTSPLGVPHTPDPMYIIVKSLLIKDDGKPSPRQRDMYEGTAELDSDGETSVFLPGLRENSVYLVTVVGKNEAGLGTETAIRIRTGVAENPIDDQVRHVHSWPDGEEEPVMASLAAADTDDTDTPWDHGADDRTGVGNDDSNDGGDGGDEEGGSDGGSRDESLGEDDGGGGGDGVFLGDENDDEVVYEEADAYSSKSRSGCSKARAVGWVYHVTGLLCVILRSKFT